MAKNLFRVKEINLYLQGLLTEDPLLQNLWVEGEISNFKCHSSGHWYFTLKGEDAALKCVIFRQWTKGVFFQPEEGMSVRVRGSITVYERDGQYLLYGEEIVAVGVGNRHLAFLALKERLCQEGLFAAERKRQLPNYPQKIGIITSADGAAYHDMQRIFQQKIPAKIKLFPCLVQGENSENSIIQAVKQANIEKDIEVLIISRGGGSKEDLAVFNTEGVTRAVAESSIPIVSAVGHEVDYTLVDFAADMRVPTPTAAANVVLPDKSLVQEQLQMAKQALIKGMTACITNHRKQLQEMAERCKLEDMLWRKHGELEQVSQRLLSAMENRKQNHRQGLQQIATRLMLFNPLQVLSRGYTISSKESGGKPLKSITEVKETETLFVQFADGIAQCLIQDISRK